MKHPISQRTFLSSVLVPVLLAGATACSRNEAAAPAPASPSREPIELTVYAAASTRDALAAIDSLFMAPGTAKILVNFGSSGDLSKQIIAAAKADVFLSADDKEMDKVEQAGLVVAGSRRPLLSNQLAVIEPASSETSLAQGFTPALLASERVHHLSLANVESVPAGRYAKAWLEAQGAWKGVADKVLPAVDVRAALGAVEAGAAEAGIVYRTDVARSTKARLAFAVPASEGPKIVYPVAALSGREHAAEAQAYLEFLRSDKARAIWEREGFVFLEDAGKAR